MLPSKIQANVYHSLLLLGIFSLLNFSVASLKTDDHILPAETEDMDAISTSLEDDYAVRPQDRMLLETTLATWWYTDVSGKKVQDLLKANKARLTSLQASSARPLTFTVSMVARTAADKPYYFIYDQTFDQLGAFADSVRGRFVDIDGYTSANGETRFAANIIVDGGTFWWWAGVQPSQIEGFTNLLDARVIDIDAYMENGIVQYAVIMVPNGGGVVSRWYVKKNIGSLDSLLQGGVLVNIDIDPSVNGDSYNFVIENRPTAWWIWFGSKSAVTEWADKLGTRIDVVKRFSPRDDYVVIQYPNIPDRTQRIVNLYNNNVNFDCRYGFYLRKLDVSTPYVSFRGTALFEPAESFNLLIATHAYRRIQSGTSTLTARFPLFTSPGATTCPTNTISGTDAVGTAITLMLQNSLSSRAKGLTKFFGDKTAITATAKSIGMKKTVMNSYTGCPYDPDFNRITLNDVNTLLDGIAKAKAIKVSSRDDLYTRLKTGNLNAIVDREAAVLGFTSAIQRAKVAAFKTALVTKTVNNGGYNLGSFGDPRFYKSTFTIAFIPACQSFRKVTETYIYSQFIDNCNADTARTAENEPLRDIVNANLRTWVAQC